MVRFEFVHPHSLSNLLDFRSGISALGLLYQCRRNRGSPRFFPPFLLFFENMDPSSLVNDWSSLSLTSEEEEISVVTDREAVDRAGLLLGLCLLEKLLCHRPLGAEAMRRNFRAAWKLDNGLQVITWEEFMYISFCEWGWSCSSCLLGALALWKILTGIGVSD